MDIFHKKDYTSDVLNRVDKRHLLFQSKENRDKAFDTLKAYGHNNIVKGTTSNQRIHPEYVEDYEGEIETGFGNSMYNTPFKKLYKIEFVDKDIMMQHYLKKKYKKQLR
jgi:hypothetical protein